MGDLRLQVVEVRDGVIGIRERSSGARPRGVFDHVVTFWEVRRASVQEISMSLEMQFELDLDPKIQGFAGDHPGGNFNDQVGPFKEHNRTIRQLLDKLVAESRGGAWILPAGDSRAWDILEYGEWNGAYAAFLLRKIAAHQVIGAEK